MLLDLFDGATSGNSGRCAESRPEGCDEQVTVFGQLSINDLLRASAHCGCAVQLPDEWQQDLATDLGMNRVPFVNDTQGGLARAVHIAGRTDHHLEDFGNERHSILGRKRPNEGPRSYASARGSKIFFVRRRKVINSGISP